METMMIGDASLVNQGTLLSKLQPPSPFAQTKPIISIKIWATPLTQNLNTTPPTRTTEMVEIRFPHAYIGAQPT